MPYRRRSWNDNPRTDACETPAKRHHRPSGQGLLCVSIQAPSTQAALERIARAGAAADLVELRLDLLPKADMEALVQASPVPVIATVRSRAEGGAGCNPPGKTVSMLARAREAGAAWVDVEMGLPPEARKEIVHQAGTGRIILSHHGMEGTPSSSMLTGLLERMAAFRPAVIKIVCLALALEDNRRVLALIPQAQAMGLGITAFCMGRMGRMSRVRSLRMGATLGYVALSSPESTAPGQIPIQEMRRMLQRSPS